MSDFIKVFAPASVSNVGCGFDTIGFAIDGLGDEIVIRKTAGSGVKISRISGDSGQLPLQPERNTAGKASLAMIDELGIDFGIEIEINKRMPLCSGLGSSAASACAAVFGLNQLLDKPLSKNELLDFALAGEFIASGSIHADNVAPSLFGGFILIRDYDPLDIIKIDVSHNLWCIVLYQHVEIKTTEARKILPNKIPVSTAREHFGNIGALVSSLYENDFELLGRSIVDKIAEPHRAKFIPNYDAVKQAALEAGAFGCNISGSGPSIFAFAGSEDSAKTIGKSMQNAAQSVKSDLFISRVNNRGAVILD